MQYILTLPSSIGLPNPWPGGLSFRPGARLRNDTLAGTNE